jgi:aspartate kinase
MIVLKFGGASLEDGYSLRRIIRIISAAPGHKAVVLSAFRGVTDRLDSLLGRILNRQSGEKQISVFVNKLQREHLDFLRQSMSGRVISHETVRLIAKQCRRLERLFYGLNYIDEITERSRDLIHSFGERLSSVITAAALNAQGINSRTLESDKIGVLTDGLFGRSSAILPRARKNIRRSVMPLIKSRVVPVITGYFGCDRQGRVTTFGRGGSDYSASVMAYALDADALELWKDVDGFMSADPVIVPEARLIKRLSYKEAAELAYFGSTILHPRTVEPVLLKNIPIIIRNTFNPSGQGTVIQTARSAGSLPIKGVTYEKDACLVKVHGYGSGFGYKSGVLNEITGCLLANNINIKSILSAPTGIGLVFSREDFEQAFSILKKKRIELVSGFERMAGQSLVAFIGEGVIRQKGIAARVFRALDKNKVNLEMISAGASSAAGFFIIRRRDLAKTIRALYREFFRR